MNEVKIFENEEFGKIRTVTIDGEPWFVGKDVADVLGYENPRSAVSKKIDVEDKGAAEMETPSGRQEMTIINESGMYSLIFGSKLESAKKFKKWVTSEVLPAIRKTGVYGQPRLPKNSMELLQLHYEAIREVDQKVDDVATDLEQFKKDLPILGVEENKITSAVRKKGVAILGGKESNAYKDKSITGSLYRDIYGQIYRNFGITTYKAIKRSQCKHVLEIIQQYEPPLVLAEKIRNSNE